MGLLLWRALRHLIEAGKRRGAGRGGHLRGSILFTPVFVFFAAFLLLYCNKPHKNNPHRNPDVAQQRQWAVIFHEEILTASTSARFFTGFAVLYLDCQAPGCGIKLPVVGTELDCNLAVRELCGIQFEGPVCGAPHCEPFICPVNAVFHPNNMQIVRGCTRDCDCALHPCVVFRADDCENRRGGVLRCNHKGCVYGPGPGSEIVLNP